ncbi:hypothetical protein K2X85_18315 [bacterium]|nr:hypothetical protein [bacterium]
MEEEADGEADTASLEQDLRRLLAQANCPQKAAKDVIEFIADPDGEFAQALLKTIKVASRGALDEHERAEVLQETYLSIYRSLQKGTKLRTTVKAFCRDIARKRTIDAVRTKIGQGDRPAVVSLSTLVDSDLEGSRLGTDMKGSLRGRLPEVQSFLLADVDRLKGKERAAAIAYVNHFEDLRVKGRFDLMAETMSRILGELVFPTQAKTAWRGAKEKLREQLVQAGFYWFED